MWRPRCWPKARATHSEKSWSVRWPTSRVLAPELDVAVAYRAETYQASGMVAVQLQIHPDRRSCLRPSTCTERR